MKYQGDEDLLLARSEKQWLHSKVTWNPLYSTLSIKQTIGD